MDTMRGYMGKNDDLSKKSIKTAKSKKVSQSNIVGCIACASK